MKFERGKRKLRFIAPRKPADTNEVVSFQSGASVAPASTAGGFTKAEI